jgi:hypothetical protein
MVALSPEAPHPFVVLFGVRVGRLIKAGLVRLLAAVRMPWIGPNG